MRRTLAFATLIGIPTSGLVAPSPAQNAPATVPLIWRTPGPTRIVEGVTAELRLVYTNRQFRLRGSADAKACSFPIDEVVTRDFRLDRHVSCGTTPVAVALQALNWSQRDGRIAFDLRLDATATIRSRWTQDVAIPVAHTWNVSGYDPVYADSVDAARAAAVAQRRADEERARKNAEDQQRRYDSTRAEADRENDQRRARVEQQRSDELQRAAELWERRAREIRSQTQRDEADRFRRIEEDQLRRWDEERRQDSLARAERAAREGPAAPLSEAERDDLQKACAIRAVEESGLLQREHIEVLCTGTVRPIEPTYCFVRASARNRVLPGGALWGARLALRLCAGTDDAPAALRCVDQRAPSDEAAWSAAVETCRKQP
jgi:hypothetical protein